MLERLIFHGRRKGRHAALRRPGCRLAAGRWIVVAWIRARSRSVSSILPLRCLITNGVYRNYSRWLCDVVIRLAAPPDFADVEETQVGAVRRLISLALRDSLNGRNPVALEAPERESSTGRSNGHLPPKRDAEPSCRGGGSVGGHLGRRLRGTAIFRSSARSVVLNFTIGWC